jgi:hypothetical protein
VFRDTGGKRPPGHVTDTMCRPDITAAFKGDWTSKNVVPWPFIRLAGETASKGKSRDDRKRQAISYLHYLLLARPDLYVAQGLLASDATVTFLFGIGGEGIKRFEAKWAHKDLYKLLYAFIYRLYAPGDFADETYIKTEIDEEFTAKYTIKITYPGRTQEDPERTQDCPGFHSIYARNPFGTRTHVLSNPDFKFEGGDLTILKDQFCQVRRRFKELDILTKHIHKRRRVPGVVVAAYGETITPPRNSSPSESEGRWKHRLGLGESGSSFMSIPTLHEVLKTLFDLLEGISISVAIRSADMFASIAVFAGRVRSPTSRYQCRKRAVCQGSAEPRVATELRVFLSWARGGGRGVAALLCQVSPGREVCIYRSRNWIVANKDWP